MDARQAGAWDVRAPALNVLQWLQCWVASWNARFASWMGPEGEEDALWSADPQLVAALEFIAALLAEEPRAKG